MAIFFKKVISAKTFFKGFVFFYCSVIVFNFFFGVALRNIGELLDHQAVIAHQEAHNSIYAPLLEQKEFFYSQRLVVSKKPSVIALGSSRVLPFRQEFFSSHFIGAGRAVVQMREAEMFFDALPEEALPRLILLGIDFSWFHPRLSQRSIRGRHNSGAANTIPLSLFRKFLSHFYEGRLNLATIYNKVVNKVEDGRYVTYPFSSLGLTALHSFQGFRKDGSYFYGGIVTGHRKAADIGFRRTLDRIEYGEADFAHGSEMSSDAWESLERFLEKARSKGVEVIVFMPPVANSVFSVMQDQRFRYIDLLQRRLSELNNFYNYHNPASMNSGDCEFMDGFHGGEVTYQRILIDISKKNGLLASHLNLPYLLQSVNDNKGRAIVKLNELESSKSFSEIDFLDLGCAKD